MIAYDFIAESMEGLDQLQAEMLVLPFFSDERPLEGAAGLVDWRLCGAMSRKLMAGYLDGHFGEKGLLAEPSRLGTGRLLMIGLGPSSAFDHSVGERACALIAEALRSSGVTTAALALPGRSLSLLPALEAMQMWLAAAPDHEALEEVSIIERTDEHRGLAALFEGLRRQAESPLD